MGDAQGKGEKPPPPVKRKFAVMGVVCAILPALGLISLQEFVFPVLWSIYLITGNSVRFDGNKKFKDNPQSALLPKPWIVPYMYIAVVVAILLPMLTMVVNYQNRALLLVCAPPLFLLIVQIACEMIANASKSAIMVRMLVPIGFNTWRLLSLWEWFMQASTFGGWHTFVAGLNFVFWVCNLLVVLLMFTVPYYLDERRCAN